MVAVVVLLMVVILLGGAFIEGLYQRYRYIKAELLESLSMVDRGYSASYDPWWRQHSYGF